MSKAAPASDRGSAACASSRPGHASGLNWKLGAASLMVLAGTLYAVHIGRGLGASEAYTAMVATQTSYSAVSVAALRFDPGKPPLYPLLLHGLTTIFGDSEIVLRAPSVICSTIAIGLVWALGSEMFGPAVGFAAAAFWALSPLTVIYAGVARMYAMLMALALAQLLTMWQLAFKPTAGRMVLCAALGAAMLYTHLGSLLFLGAEGAILAGQSLRGERNRARWTALIVSLALFAPFLPIAASQVRELVFGHWVDWIGPAHPVSLVRKTCVIVGAGAIAAALSFGPRLEADEHEPIRWCATLAILPIVALIAGSLAVRPMFSARYVAPSLSVLALLLARLLAFLRGRAFGLSAFGVACFLFFLLPSYPRSDTWRDFARQVSKGSPREPVFFESGYVDSTASETNPEMGFPQGFFRVPFDRYFSGPNPRLVIDPSAPQADGRVIANAAIANGGAWLVSGLKDAKARAEMPTGCFKIEKKTHSDYADLYHIAPIAHCSQSDSLGPRRGQPTTAPAGAAPVS